MLFLIQLATLGVFHHGTSTTAALSVPTFTFRPRRSFSYPTSSSTSRRLNKLSSFRSGSSVLSEGSSTVGVALNGVGDFESWLQTNNVENIRVRHDLFESSLRGLSLISNSNVTSQSGLAIVASIPDRLVLSTQYDEEAENMWDAELAWKLCEELALKEKSAFSGYLSLLTFGTFDCSVPTAPHSIRHWTEDQKEILLDSVRGTKLLQLHEKQQKKWREKYEKFCSLKNGVSFDWETFSWAMEAVHSRAFKGIGGSSTSFLPKILAPIIAGIIGFEYSQSVVEANLIVLTALGILSLLPTFLGGLSSTQTVALLPVIDSANHLESADSEILYDPIQKVYQLKVGNYCIQHGQLFISYGKKKDTELLLNYGFLPGVKIPHDDEDTIREVLAKAYIQQ